jgi:hypothetical protein
VAEFWQHDAQLFRELAVQLKHKIMTVYYQSFLFFFIIFALTTYLGRRDSTSGRRGIRLITGYGVAFCVLGLNLWFVTRFEDVLSSFPRPHQATIFAMPWLWVSALCVGVALLVISFLTRKNRRHAA